MRREDRRRCLYIYIYIYIYGDLTGEERGFAFSCRNLTSCFIDIQQMGKDNGWTV